ncbi:MAG: CHASE domain-containing protein [Cyanobacteria bacterium]|nr:CHASE domain-containing protein [Cyanobacteriota bacterium]MDA0866216.1 CHASE domain-containing protein [Cyanobacteriota bacterium]
MIVKISRQLWILGITATVGVSLSAIATRFVYRWEVSQQQRQFQQQIETLAIALQRSLNRYKTVLTFLGDHYGVNQEPVQPSEFDAFVARSLAEYPGIQALEWAPLVAQGERAAYEAAMQAQGDGSFQITELDGNGDLQRSRERSYYIPVTYLAPLVGNEAALGFDLNSSPTRVAAIDPARDSGQIHVTGRVRLVQEQRDQYGFLVVLPLYQTGTVPDSQASRRSQFDGILIGVFRVADVVEEALQGLSYAIDFELQDQGAPAAAQLLGRYEADKRTVTALPRDPDVAQHRRSQALCPIPQTCTRTLSLGQREWVVTFMPAATYPVSPLYSTAATLLTGLLLTGSLVLLLHHLQNELIRSQQVKDLKLRFFSMASHELRTPLSTILLSTESLQINSAQFSETQKQQSLERIHLTAQQMSQQIADLLTLTRAEVGKLDFSPELLEGGSFCRQVIAEAQAGISQTIEFRDDGTPVKAFWDKKMISSLLSNLLTNAAKYSPTDQPIHVELSSNDQTATVQVSDRGIGIPAADQARLGEAFQRGSNVGDIGGTGLGLAIVQVCVELHRGHWHLDSKEGQGTRVVVTLPLE